MIKMGLFRDIVNDLKIHALCYNNGISDDKDAILLSDIHEVTNGGKKGILFFEIQNPTKESVDKLIGSLRYLRNDSNHRCQVEYLERMFTDPDFRVEKYETYEKKILPLISECTIKDIARYYFKTGPKQISIKTATSPQ